MKHIELTQGYIALVDDSDFDWINSFKWRAHVKYKKDGSVQSVYAERTLPRINGKRPMQSMHRLILPTELEVDHRDGNGLNNQRGNLREATSLQQKHNSKKKKASTAASQHKGVYWDRKAEKWGASIRHAGKRFFLGYFLEEEEAAIAYNAAAKEYQGEFVAIRDATGDPY
jgi:hypothetical protein